jgi:hypothetical protein
MFSHLTDFSRKRSAAGAIGFYIAYVVFTLAFNMVLAFLIQTYMPAYPVRERGFILMGVVVFVSLTLSLLIIQSKNLNTSIPLLMLSLCSAVLAANGGAVLGLIIPAALSALSGPSATRSAPKKKRRK